VSGELRGLGDEVAGWVRFILNGYAWRGFLSLCDPPNELDGPPLFGRESQTEHAFPASRRKHDTRRLDLYLLLGEVVVLYVFGDGVNDQAAIKRV